MPKPIKDSDGTEVKEGDIIHFSYGIPPVGVRAPVVMRGGKLIALTTGHNPSECPVSKKDHGACRIFLGGEVNMWGIAWSWNPMAWRFGKCDAIETDGRVVGVWYCCGPLAICCGYE